MNKIYKTESGEKLIARDETQASAFEKMGLKPVKEKNSEKGK